MRSRLLVVLFTVFGLFWSLQLWAEDSPKVADAPAELKVANRSVMVFRATLLGEAPASRVKRAKAVIGEALDEADDLKVTLDPIMTNYMVLLGSRRAFIVTPKDFDATEFDSVQQAAEAAAEKLRQVVAETQEARSLHLILRSVGAALLATGVYLGLLLAMVFLRRKLLKKLPDLMHRHTQALKVGRVPLIDANFLYPLVSRVLEVLRWVIVLLLTYEWLGFVLSRFPYTRPWGKALTTICWKSPTICCKGFSGPSPGSAWRWRSSSLREA